MKPTNALLPAALLALSIVACSQTDPNNIAIDESNGASATTDVETLPPSEESGTAVDNGANNMGGDNEAAPIPPVIPAAFRGRWGLVPADCTSTRGDAKGLIDIDGNSIKFYEARAMLTKVMMNAPENFTGTFAFTGEGQTWTKSQNLKLTGSSNTLIRGDTDPVASFTYKRCA